MGYVYLGLNLEWSVKVELKEGGGGSVSLKSISGRFKLRRPSYKRKMVLLLQGVFGWGKPFSFCRQFRIK